MSQVGSFWLGLGFGVLLGAVIVASWVAWRARQADKSGRSIRVMEAQHQQFRDEVNHHFVETAELINRMTDSYKAVFDHLSRGAERLVEDRVVQERMPKVGDHEVRLKHIGHRVKLEKDIKVDEV